MKFSTAPWLSYVADYTASFFEQKKAELFLGMFANAHYPFKIIWLGSEALLLTEIRE